MKKKLSLVLAFLMAASMMAGCKKTDEESGIPDSGSDVTSLSELTKMTMPTESETETESESEETTAPTEETTESSSETTETTTASETETSETTVSASETTTTAVSSATVTAAEATAAAQNNNDWNETEISETLYIKTSCYSRTRAIVGSDSVKKYSAGQKINIVAATDTGYYKLADGTFIHSDYVTDEKPEKKTTTAATTDPEEIFIDDTPTTTKKPSQNTSSPVNASYSKSYKDRYPYQQLSSAEQTLYANIVEAAENFETEVKIPDGFDRTGIKKVYALVYNQEPQLFWLSTKVPSALGGNLYLEFAISQDTAAEYQKTIDKNVKSIMSKVNSYSSTVSKLKVIYDWVVTNNTFSLEGNYKSCSVYNGLAGGQVLQCQGYAKSVQYLCDIAGIESMVVTGNNADGDSHAWNVVYCDNGYYILDTTWGDPMTSYGRSSYVRYLFFLANDSMTKNTHLNVSTISNNDGTRTKLYTPPACTKTACYYFKAYNKEYSDVDSAAQALYGEIAAAVSEGKNVAHIRVTDKDTWDTLRSNTYWKAFQDYAKKQDSSVSKLIKQTTLTEDILVVEYDIVYKD